MDRFTIDTRSGSRYIGLSIMALIRFYGPCTGQQCASGFPGMPFPQLSGRNTYFSGRSFAVYSILIPGMNFTCDGTITRVIVGGMRRSGKNKKKVKLCIWKENATEPGIYHRSGKAIALALNNNMCNERNRRCTLQLMEEKQISVESGDLLGIEVPRSNAADFELNSVPMPGLMNYIFSSNQHSMVNLSDRMDVIEEQPLIMFRLNRRDSGTII